MLTRSRLVSPKENAPIPNDTHETGPTRFVRAGDVRFAYRLADRLVMIVYGRSFDLNSLGTA